MTREIVRAFEKMGRTSFAARLRESGAIYFIGSGALASLAVARMIFH